MSFKNIPVEGCPGFYMRVPDYVLKSVVFFGFEDDTPGKGGINCVGTGFLVSHDDFRYLVTARHIAAGLGSRPFLVRVNKTDGTSQNLHADEVRWFTHPDPSVDVALIPFSPNDPSLEVLYIPTNEVLLSADRLSRERYGPGDLTYTTGLFRLLSGERRNMTVVHSGSIALMPGNEKIPVKDWRAKGGVLHCEGFLVETQCLSGLSGSPVFVRATTPFAAVPLGATLPNNIPKEFLRHLTGLGVKFEPMLLGLWQASWDAPPDEVAAIQSGANVRVPIGMGIVVPAQKILDVLDLQEMRDMREQAKAQHSTPASPDSAIPAASGDGSAEPPSTSLWSAIGRDATEMLHAGRQRRADIVGFAVATTACSLLGNQRRQRRKANERSFQTDKAGRSAGDD